MQTLSSVLVITLSLLSAYVFRYRAWAIDPENYRNHAPPPMRASLPFDGTTTNREMFKGWQLPPHRPALGVQVGCFNFCVYSLQGCCSTVYSTVYGNTVRYGKNVFYRIFENWHRIYGKIRYSVQYNPFFLRAGCAISLAVQSAAADESKNLQALGFFILSSFLPESTFWQCLQHHFTLSC